MNPKRALADVAQRIREKAEERREEANTLDATAIRLEFLARVQTEDEVKRILKNLQDEVPELFPS